MCPRSMRMRSGDGFIMGNFVVCTVHLIFVVFVFRVIKSRRLRWAGHVARMEEVRSAYKILTGTPTGKKPLGRPRRGWEDNIRIDLK